MDRIEGKKAHVLREPHALPDRRVTVDSGRTHGVTYVTGMDLSNLARPERFELPTPWFVAKYSIQLSYGRVEGANPITGRADC